MISKLKKIISALMAIFMLVTFLPTRQVEAKSQLGKRLMVGYWHNFDNNSKIVKLRDVDDSWDVINVSFGETNESVDKATILFKPDPSIESEEEFILKERK